MCENYGYCYLLENPSSTNGENFITNYWGGLLANYNSTIVATNGHNRTSMTEVPLEAGYSSVIYAVGNCWEWVYVLTWNGGVVYWNPVWNCSFGKASATNRPETVSEAGDFMDENLKEAYNNLQNGNYEQAISQFSQRYKNENNVRIKRYILPQLAECYKRSGKKDFIQFLNNEVSKGLSKTDELYAMSLELENIFNMSDKNYDKVLENLKTLKVNFIGNEETYKHTLFNLANITYSCLKDVSKANEYLSELKEKYPKDRLTTDAMFLFGEIDSTARSFRNEDILKNETPTTYTLLNNFPNPFNPTTTISFSLPGPSEVELKVYDMLGRKVATLVDGQKDAGYHSATFDGSRLSSGIYFVRFTAASQDGSVPFTKTMKILMTK